MKGFETELENHEMTIYITPLRERVNVNVESAMAARMEEADVYRRTEKRKYTADI